MIQLILKHITYKYSLNKVITKSFHPSDQNTSNIMWSYGFKYDQIKTYSSAQTGARAPKCPPVVPKHAPRHQKLILLIKF